MKADKESGAWTEVSTDFWCPKASIMAPGGRDQGDFRVSVWAGDNKFLPGKGIYLQTTISSPLCIYGERISRLDRGLVWCLAPTASITAFVGRSGRKSEIPGGLMMYTSCQVRVST